MAPPSTAPASTTASTIRPVGTPPSSFDDAAASPGSRAALGVERTSAGADVVAGAGFAVVGAAVALGARLVVGVVVVWAAAVRLGDDDRCDAGGGAGVDFGASLAAIVTVAGGP